ncbi:Vacuolar sorting protein, partial [Phytophthora palmivora]
SVQLQTGDAVQLQRKLAISKDPQANQEQANKTLDVAVVAPPITTMAKRFSYALRAMQLGVAGFIRQANLALGLIPVDRGVAALCHDSVFGELYTRKRGKKMLELAHRQQQKIKMNRAAGVKDGEAVIASAQLSTSADDTDFGCSYRYSYTITVIRQLQGSIGYTLTTIAYLIGIEEADNARESGRSSSRTEATSTTQKVVLNHVDALFGEIRDVNFNLVSNQLMDVAKDLSVLVNS